MFLETMVRPESPESGLFLPGEGQICPFAAIFRIFFPMTHRDPSILVGMPNWGAMSVGHGGDRIELHRDDARVMRVRTVKTGDRQQKRSSGPLAPVLGLRDRVGHSS